MGAWSPDGREVITASTDGSARVWDVSPMAGSLAELQCRAELLAAHRLAAHRGLEPLTAGEMNERWQALRGK